MSFNGTWRPVKTDLEGMKKFYELLEAPPAIIEGIAIMEKIYYTSEDHGDSMTMTIHGTPGGDKVKNMKLGEEVEDQGRLGKYKTKLVRDGNKIVSNETYENGKTSTTTREVSGDEMTITLSTGGHTVTHVYKRD